MEMNEVVASYLKGFDEGMDGTAILLIPAEAASKMSACLFLHNGDQVGEVWVGWRCRHPR